MKTLNQTIKEMRESRFPSKKYVCACKFQCAFFNNEMEDCDNCEYCGTTSQLPDQETQQQHEHYMNGLPELTHEGVY